MGGRKLSSGRFLHPLLRPSLIGDPYSSCYCQRGGTDQKLIAGFRVRRSITHGLTCTLGQLGSSRANLGDSFAGCSSRIVHHGPSALTCRGRLFSKSLYRLANTLTGLLAPLLDLLPGAVGQFFCP